MAAVVETEVVVGPREYIQIAALPAPAEVPEIRPLLGFNPDGKIRKLLIESLGKAKAAAARPPPNGLDPALFKALPFPDMEWPTTFEEYCQFLVRFVHWIPQQSKDPVWTNPTNPLGEHQEVYDRLCYFYWLIDQPLDSGGVLQDEPEFAKWLVEFARAWGRFLDSCDSFNDQILESFMKYSPEYRVQDSMIGPPDHKRPNAAGGWKSFNSFFARSLNPGLRPITDPTTNTTITCPADCTYKANYRIQPDGSIKEIVIKGTHTYGNVHQLLEKSQFAEAFDGGYFIHFFLGPYSYHRFHTPVAGVVKECYPLTGQVYLKVAIGGQQFQAADSAQDGYEFLQARGVIVIDTARSEFGDIGLVAVIPVGMCQVSGVNMTHVPNTPCAKGDEFGYFTFGGSDIIVLTQASANPQYNPLFTPPPGGSVPYSLYGTEIAKVQLKP